jgi:hypothetical protein
MVFSNTAFATLVLSTLVPTVLSSDTSPSKGKVNFNQKTFCNGRFDSTELIEVDKCIPVKHAEYQVLQVASQRLATRTGNAMQKET